MISSLYSSFQMFAVGVLQLEHGIRYLRRRGDFASTSFGDAEIKSRAGATPALRISSYTGTIAALARDYTHAQSTFATLSSSLPPRATCPIRRMLLLKGINWRVFQAFTFQDGDASVGCTTVQLTAFMFLKRRAFGL